MTDETIISKISDIIDRLLMFELSTDGIVWNKQRAEESMCECFTLPSGKPYCWSKGIIGALSQSQITTYCPPEKRVKHEGGIPARITKFISASEECEIGKIFEGKTIKGLEDRLRCMSVAAAKRGIKI